MYLFIYLVESSKVSEWKEKVPRLVLLFVKKEWNNMKHDFGLGLYGEKLGSFCVSGKLLTYPSPKPTLTLTSHLVQNVGLGEG